MLCVVCWLLHAALLLSELQHFIFICKVDGLSQKSLMALSSYRLCNSGMELA